MTRDNRLSSAHAWGAGLLGAVLVGGVFLFRVANELREDVKAFKHDLRQDSLDHLRTSVADVKASLDAFEHQIRQVPMDVGEMRRDVLHTQRLILDSGVTSPTKALLVVVAISLLILAAGVYFAVPQPFSFLAGILLLSAGVVGRLAYERRRAPASSTGEGD